MADVMDYQDVYRRLGDMQSRIDDLFLQAVESSEFRSASIIIRLNVGLERKVEKVDVLSQEYRSSDFAKKAGQLGQSLISEESVDSRSLRVRFIWSDAYELLGNSALSPISDSVVSKLYVGSVIRRRYENSIQDMFQRIDRSSGSSASGNILVDLQIEKDGKVSQASMVDASLSGSTIEKSVQDLVKSWSFPGVKSQLKVRTVLARVNPLMSSSSESSHPSQIWIDGIGWVSSHVLMNFSSQNWGSSMSSSQICQTLSFDGRLISVPCDQLFQLQSSSSSQRCPVILPNGSVVNVPCDQVMQASSQGSSQTCPTFIPGSGWISLPCSQQQVQSSSSSSSQLCFTPCDQIQRQSSSQWCVVPCGSTPLQSSSSSQWCFLTSIDGSTSIVPCSQILRSSSSSQLCLTPCDQTQRQSSSSSQWCITPCDQTQRQSSSSSQLCVTPCDQVMQSSSSSQNCFRISSDGRIYSVPCSSMQSAQSSSSQWCRVTLPDGSSTFMPCDQVMQSSSSSSQTCLKVSADGTVTTVPCSSMQSSSSSTNCFQITADGRIISVPCSSMQSAQSSSSQWCTTTLRDGSTIIHPCDQTVGMQSSSSSSSSSSSKWCTSTLSNGSTILYPCDQPTQTQSSSSSTNCFQMTADGRIISVPCSSMQSSSSSQDCFRRLPDGSIIPVPCSSMQSAQSSSSQWCTTTLRDGSTIIHPCDQTVGMQSSSSSSSSKWCTSTLPNGNTILYPCDQPTQTQSSSSSQDCFRRLSDGSIISVPCSSMQSSQSSQNCFQRMSDGSFISVPCASVQSASSQTCLKVSADGTVTTIPCDQTSRVQAASSSPQTCIKVLADGTVTTIPCDQTTQIQSSFPSQGSSSSKCTVVLQNGQTYPCDQFNFGNVQSSSPFQPFPFPPSSGSSSLSPLDLARLQASSGSQISPVGSPSVPCHVITNDGRVVPCDQYMQSSLPSPMIPGQQPSPFPSPYPSPSPIQIIR